MPSATRGLWSPKVSFRQMLDRGRDGTGDADRRRNRDRRPDRYRRRDEDQSVEDVQNTKGEGELDVRLPVEEPSIKPPIPRPTGQRAKDDKRSDDQGKPEEPESPEEKRKERKLAEQKRKEREAEFEELKEALTGARNDAKSEETRMRESAWQSTCFRGSLFKLIRTLVYIIFFLPTLTLISDLFSGAAFIVALLASYLQLEGLNLRKFIVISSVLLFIWSLYRGIKGPDKDILHFAEHMDDHITLEFMKFARVFRSNPYSGQLTVTRYVTVFNHLEYGFSTILWIWRLDLDDMNFFGTTQSFRGQYGHFNFEITRARRFKDLGGGPFAGRRFKGKKDNLEDEDYKYKYRIRIKDSHARELLCDSFDYVTATRMLRYYKIFDFYQNNLFCHPDPLFDAGVQKCAVALSVPQDVRHLKSNSSICVLCLAGEIEVR